MDHIQVIGLDKLERNLSLLELHVLPQATARALNTTATTVRAESIREIAQRMGLKQKDIRNRARIRRATPQKIDAGADVTFRGRPMNLIRFNPRQTKKGVAASPWRQRKTFGQTFIVDLGRGKFVGVRRALGRNQSHERAKELRRTARVRRIPVVGVVGPGVAETAAETDIARSRADTVKRVLPERLERELAFYVSRLER